jgi:tetratricopeptide (TPR) repeat protein
MRGKRKSDRAERLLRLSRAELPDDPAWPYFLGRERFGEGRYAEASALFEESLQLAARQPRFGRTLELRLWLVKCAFAERRWDEVRTRCEAILEETPDFPDAHYFLAQALIMQAKEKFRVAEEFAMGAAESAKTYRGTVAADMSIREWRAPVLLADLAVHRGKLAEARAIYRAYVRKAGPHADAIKRKLAFIERQRKKLEQAGLPLKR